MLEATQIDCILELADLQGFLNFDNTAARLKQLRQPYNRIPVRVMPAEHRSNREELSRLLSMAGSVIAKIMQSAAFLPPESVLVPTRLAPSALYDVEYRTAAIALVFAQFARTIAPSTLRKISAAKLKLMQFFVLRPWLPPAIKEWSEVGPHEGLAVMKGRSLLGLSTTLRQRSYAMKPAAFCHFFCSLHLLLAYCP